MGDPFLSYVVNREQPVQVNYNHVHGKPKENVTGNPTLKLLPLIGLPDTLRKAGMPDGNGYDQ
jgi:hypothetical protein